MITTYTFGGHASSVNTWNLGDTLEKIAVQKAGIIKPHTQVVCAAQKEEAQKVIEETCKSSIAACGR